MSIIACCRTCWPCKFDDHNPQWHSWAGMDERDMPIAKGEVDPLTERCGCYCCADADEVTPIAICGFCGDADHPGPC